MTISRLSRIALGASAFAALAFAPVAGSAKPARDHQSWWKSAVIYEIYPRSFQDSNGDGIGDLNGVTQRLDYLQKLGVDAIWLTPFFPSPNADFGYDVADYTGVAPEYGTMQDWDRLTREARKRGIRVLVDFVLNHSSDQHPWFKESRSSRTNPKRDWYVWRDPAPDGGPPTNWQSIFGGSTWEYDKATHQYYYHIFLPQQPDVNWANPGLKRAMYDVMRFWLRHGASGFRLDATPYLFEDPNWPNDPEVKSGRPVWLKPYNSGLPAGNAILRDMRRIVDKAPGDAVLLGESSTATIEDLRKVYGAKSDEINLPMNFLYGNLTKLDAPTFKKQIDDAQMKLDGLPPVFFFSSHDHSRQWTSFGDGVHNDAIARVTSAMTLTLRGTALLYYGEEIGMADLPKEELQHFPLGPKRKVADNRDPERSPMQWTGDASGGFTTGAPWLPVASAARTVNVAAQIRDPASMYAWYARLLQLRRTNAALRDGAYLPLESGNPDVVAYARIDAEGRGVLVLLNMSAAPQSLSISGWRGRLPQDASVLLASPATDKIDLQAPALEPYGVQLVQFTSRR
ncbi:alpha-amylase family glycosyl hydrolase [Novosphingobium sp. KCTC 2891]|uniref:alpha-glucosidase n=1 Tax=Novosphingobium sp. KCTC 2891 TaxID=2989730 RepID=UPI002221A130|nr:alpha-glucosidase [Novosphingobium sp. KCTC 2891]MCW1383756.1 alpha-amylase family glycosyl hydrolase [Novosphingobium sp. KCTC 2891]